MTLKMKPADRRALRTAAKAKPDHIDRKDLALFLEICEQWNVRAKDVLPLLDPRTHIRWKHWRTNILASGYKIKQTPQPTWCEVPVGILGDDVPDEWEAPPVIVTEDPLVTRKRKWNELEYGSGTPLVQPRTVSAVVRYFCPCSDSRNYFDADKIDAIDALGTVTTMDISDVPEPDV